MITIREGSYADNDDLLDLTRDAPMMGLISLRIERDPDFFRLLNLRGGGIVYVATVGDRLIGCISVTFHAMYIRARVSTIAYVGDLKVHPDFAGTRAALKLILRAAEHCRASDVDLASCVVSKGNEKALGVLLHGKCGTPKFHDYGKFLVYQLLPSVLRGKHGRYDIVEAREQQMENVWRLCDDFNRSYELGPCRSREEFDCFWKSLSTKPQLGILTAQEGEKIQATVSCFDACHVKQNVLVRMPKALQWGVAALQTVSRLLPLYSLPAVGEPVRILYLRNVAFRTGHHEALKSLVQHARHHAFRNRYSFVTIGIHERDPLCSLFRGIPKYTMVAHCLVASLSNAHDALRAFSTGVPMEDFALV